MSKELIERLRLMSADTYGNDAADALESLEAAYSGAVEAGKALAKQALKAERERDAIAEELKALREQKPSCWTTYPPSGRYSKCKAEVDLWERNNWTIVPLYTHPVPARELTDETIQRHWDEACKDTPQTPGWSRHIRFARAIERHLKGEGE